MPKASFKRRDFDLVSKMDKLAVNLIAAAEDGKVELADKLGAFGVVTKWIAVKNRVTENDGDGADINSYKDRISQGADDPRARLRDAKSSAGRAGMAKRWGGDTASGRGGRELTELRSRLPTADDGGADGDRPAAGGSGDPVYVNSRGHSIGGFGDAGTEQPESGNTGSVRVSGDSAADPALS